LCIAPFLAPLEAQPSRNPVVGVVAALDSRDSSAADPASQLLAQASLSETNEPLDFLPEWVAPIFSALVPGGGQLRLGQDRFAVYAAVEAYGWVRYLRHRADGRRARDGYRALAAEVARSLFTPNGRPGSFEYYESMEKYLESGVFDMSDEADLQPEQDVSTFNGFLWRRARETFWEDPEVSPPPDSRAYEQAIAYYQERAVTDEFRWSWRDAQLEYDLFRRTIAGSNQSYRQAVQDLGVILANHVLSTVDAFVTLRLHARPGAAAPGYGFSASIPLRKPGP
jgi:hypothetical protein